MSKSALAVVEIITPEGVVPMCHDVNVFRLHHDWWVDIGNRRPPKTTSLYRGAVGRFFSETGAHPLDVTAASVGAFIDEHRTQHANLYRHALDDFFAFLTRRGVRADNPLSPVRRRRAPRQQIKRSLTEDELVRTLVAAVYLGRYRRRWEGGRIALLMLAQFYTGLRPGELVRLTTAHVHLDEVGPYIEVTDTKTDADRLVPLSARAADVFTELCRDRVGRLCDVGTTAYWTWVKQATLLAGVPIEKTRPYALRHSFARYLTAHGVPDRDVAQLMGHVSLRAMWGYTVPDEAALRRAVEVLP